MLPSSVVPYRNSNVVERLGDELLLFDTEIGTLFELNESGRDIWILCDGRRSVDMIKKEVARKSVNRERAHRDASCFLSKLIELNLVTTSCSRRRSKVTSSSHSIRRLTVLGAQSDSNPHYTPPRISEVWSERSATSGLFLVEI